MYPFLHAMTGTLAFPFTQRRPVDFLLCMFFGLFPDIDIMFNLLPNSILSHRNLFHTIFPGAIVVGAITYFLFKSFMLGFLPIVMHFLGDLFGSGKVAVLPGVFLNYDIVPHQLIFSSVVGMLILVYSIWKFNKVNKNENCISN